MDKSSMPQELATIAQQGNLPLLLMALLPQVSPP
jgi:hypothetical protein